MSDSRDLVIHRTRRLASGELEGEGCSGHPEVTQDAHTHTRSEPLSPSRKQVAVREPRAPVVLIEIPTAFCF